MRKIQLDHERLRASVRFTDLFCHTMEKEKEILEYYHAGDLRPPTLIEYGSEYLIFNGNHRVLVAINNQLTISCNVLEDLADILQAQADEGEQDRDISAVFPLTFEGVVDDLVSYAQLYREVDPSRYAYE